MHEIGQFLLEPLRYPFMVRGLIAAVLTGGLCAVVGTFVVLRGMAFFGDALAHSIMPGIAIGYLLGAGSREALFWWGLGTAILAALGIAAFSQGKRQGKRLKEDTAIGVLFAGAMALGIVLISTARSYAVDLTHFMFGNVLGVGDQDLLRLVIFAVIVIGLISLFFKEFLVISFDPVLAVTMRLPIRLLENLLLILMAITIIVALQTVGIALMVAMLVTPAATAYLLTRRLPVMIALAVSLAAFSAIVGLYASYYANVASGASIVLTATLIFLAVRSVRR